MIAYGILSAIRKIGLLFTLCNIGKDIKYCIFQIKKCSFNSWLSAPTLNPKCKGFQKWYGFLHMCIYLCADINVFSFLRIHKKKMAVNSQQRIFGKLPKLAILLLFKSSRQVTPCWEQMAVFQIPDDWELSVRQLLCSRHSLCVLKAFFVYGNTHRSYCCSTSKRC